MAKRRGKKGKKKGWWGQKVRHSWASKKGWRNRKRTILVRRDPYTRRDGTRVSGTAYRTRDFGKRGVTPKKDQWFEAEVAIKDYDVDHSDATRQRVIRKKLARMGGATYNNTLKMFRHFHGLENLTSVSNPKASRIYRKDKLYIDKMRERRFGSK